MAEMRLAGTTGRAREGADGCCWLLKPETDADRLGWLLLTVLAVRIGGGRLTGC
jgi:hypothetical protein